MLINKKIKSLIKLVLTPEIVFEDQLLAVIDKPAGMIVNRSQTTKAQQTVQDWAIKKFGLQKVKRGGIVHRLDKETSGLLLIAKNEKVMNNLQQQFKKRLVNKTYLALVHGQIKPEKGVIKAPVKRNPFNKRKFGVFVGGKTAETSYQVKKIYQDYSLVKVKPKTGRTHQIRVHMKHINHPIVADESYAGRKTVKKDRQWCPRLWLVAKKIEFYYPFNKQRKVKFEVKIPDELLKILNKLLV